MNSTDLKSRLTFTVTVMVALTLCIAVLGMVTAFLLGLWAKEVDNAEISPCYLLPSKRLSGASLDYWRVCACPMMKINDRCAALVSNTSGGWLPDKV